MMIINNNDKIENTTLNNDNKTENININNNIISNILLNITSLKENTKIEFDNDNMLEFNIEYLYTIYKFYLQNTIEIFDFIKIYIDIIIKFMRLLIIYLIEKYYYNLNDIYFILKSSKDVETFNFFTNFNNLKTYLNFFSKKKDDKSGTRFSCFYIILLLIYIYFGPISWFLIRVLTDAQNWMDHTLDIMIILPVPLLQ